MTTVAILGASNNPDRYSNKAQVMLKEYGHKAVPVSLHNNQVLGIPAVKRLSDIQEAVDTVTVYVSPTHLHDNVVDDLEAHHPRRVIFNPGSENPAVIQRLRNQGIDVEEACTLVLLRTGQF